MKEKNIRLKSFKFRFVFGFGIWKDVYNKEDCGLDGYAYIFLIPFVIMKFSVLYLPNELSKII